MSKRNLWILTISLCMVMLGLIFLQFMWGRNAMELKNEQFKQLVNNTLTDVSDKLNGFYASQRMKALMMEENLTLQKEKNGYAIKLDAEGDQPVIQFDEQIDQTMILGDSSLRFNGRMELVGDSILLIEDKERGRMDTIRLKGTKDEEGIEDIELLLKNREELLLTVFKEMLLEDVSFEERVSQEQLEKVLYKSFFNLGINLEYEYAVVENNRKDVYHSESYSNQTDCYYFRAVLLSNKLHEEETFLYLYFPNQNKSLRGSLGTLGPLTAALTILMIVLFSITLYVIFRQKKLSEVTNDFVSNMTHELKTPISTISLASQMLNDDSIPIEKKNISNISKIIATESKRLGYQVERVLQMAVLDQGHLVLKKAPLYMSDIVEAVLHNFRIQIESKNGKIELRNNSSRDRIEGDRVHLTNVVTNLLDNAVKYSKEIPEIELSLYTAGDFWGMKVKDSGIGISRDNQKRIFDRFYRVSTGNVHDVKGFGLGLSYVKLIVEQHGGSIHVSSELGKGTSFDILLPIFDNDKE